MYSEQSAELTVSLGEVRSETGTLRRVLVHRPGSELDCLTPQNASALLFDDAVRPERACAEHDAVTATLRQSGVEVLHLEDLLAGSLRDPTGRAAAIAAAAPGLDSARREALVERLADLDACALAATLIAGDGDHIDPLPNQMFVRDTSAWLGKELVLGALGNPVRQREADLVQRAYSGHPVFAGSSGPPRALRLPALEGGDLFCLGERVVLVGAGSRTGVGSIEGLAEALFSAGFERVLVVEVPAERASIHLDCLMSFVDSDALLIAGRLRRAPVVEMLPPGGWVESRIHLDLPAALAAALGLDAVRVIEIADEREQWALAANTLALGPGRVVAYEHNARTNEALAAAGVEVLTVPGEELGRGHGGPRCLTCPLNRDAAAA